MSWESDEELTKESKFIRFAEGQNEYTFADDGSKVRNQYGNAQVEFKTADGRILQVRPGPMLNAIAAAKKKHGTLVSHKLRFVRSGLGKEDTRYSAVEVL
jgi:hypothetical protein